MVNVYILADKSLFLSKRAVDRLKKDIRSSNDLNTIQSSKYIEDHQLVIEEKGEDVSVDVITNKQYNRNLLKNKLYNSTKNLKLARTGQQLREMKELKKTVPKSIFKKYMNIQNSCNFPIPKPDEIMNNLDKYTDQIKMFSSGMIKITGNTKTDQQISNYFKQLGESLGVQPMNYQEIIDSQKNKAVFNNSPQIEELTIEPDEDDSDTDTEYESDSE